MTKRIQEQEIIRVRQLGLVFVQQYIFAIYSVQYVLSKIFSNILEFENVSVEVQFYHLVYNRRTTFKLF